MNGNVGPTDLRAASSVNIIKIEPINTSIVSGLPTLWAKISGGNNGRYKADDKSTPNINEAWVGGKAPKKRKKKNGKK